MSHLTPERLAALVDEEPMATEIAHLMACARCAGEREAHRALVAMAELERASIGLPRTSWESISPVVPPRTTARRAAARRFLPHERGWRLSIDSIARSVKR